MPRIFFVAGEESGDAHGADLIAALRARMPALECEGLGGRKMAAAGMHLRHDLAADAIMGFTEVLRRLPALRRLMRETEARLAAWRPDALVLIDYPGFNIRLARRAHALGIPVVYYISPQVWAWKKGRLKTLARCVDKMLVIFPFEEAIYRGIGVDCVYVGHPLIERTANYTPRRSFEGDPVIGLLPGSRAQEIARLLPPLLDTARGIAERLPRARFVCPCVNEDRAAQIRALAGEFPLELCPGGMYDVLAAARFCMVASGTATLETALFGVPFVIVYRLGAINYALARMLVNIRHIGIVNIIAGREIVPEFIQQRASAAHLLPVALELIADTPRRARMLEDLAALRGQLHGGAATRAAREIADLLHAKKAQGNP
jgi:lipid-A-disaccharide synthase